MSKHSERATQLREFVRQELDLYKSKQISQLTPMSQLAEQFGYKDTDRARSVLRRARMMEERDTFDKESRKESLQPSVESAWMLGVLTVGGFVRTEKPVVIVITRDKTFAEKFSVIGEHIFKTNANARTHKDNYRGREREDQRISFHNYDIITTMGDLKAPNWVNTIREKYDWILKNSDYSWAFLEGMFERIGSIDKKIADKTINLHLHGVHLDFQTSYPEVADFISHLLGQLGIQKPNIIYDSTLARGVKRVSIGNVVDMQMLAGHIHSVVPEREALLEMYRVLDTRRGNPSYERYSFSEENALQEYQKLLQMLGREPTRNDINRLRREQRTKYSSLFYSRNFGNGSFKSARENIRKKLGSEDFQTKAIVRKNPSWVRITNEEILSEWERLNHILGHEPNSTELVNLKKKKETNISIGTYAKRFGGGSFPTAQENIRRILGQRDNKIEQYSQEFIKPAEQLQSNDFSVNQKTLNRLFFSGYRLQKLAEQVLQELQIEDQSLVIYKKNKTRIVPTVTYPKKFIDAMVAKGARLKQN